MKLLDEKGLTTVWAAIKNTFTSKSDADGKYAKTADVNTALAKKVDAVSGKGLSTNDFTAAYKSKLDEISSSFDGKDFHSYDQEGTEKRTISLPDKDGTLALTSDLPQVSKGSSYGMTEKGMINIVYRNIQQIILLDKSGAYNISNWYKNSPEGSILDMYPYGLSGGSLNSDINNLFKKMVSAQNGPHLKEVSSQSISYNCRMRLIHINNAVLIAEYVMNNDL